MAHGVSKKGIVGLGALGQALDRFIPDRDEPVAVFFAVKAFDLEAAITEQMARWPISLPFVIMSNGYIWPVIQKIQPQLGERTIRIGMTTIGSTIQSDGRLKVFSENTMTAWGHWPIQGYSMKNPKENELQLIQCFPGGAWFDDIRPMIRQKWILNVAINSIAAAYRLQKNALLYNHRHEISDVLDEAFELADKLWPDLGWKELEKESISAKLWQVVEATSENLNSMVKDVLLGRPTESEYLAGLAQGYNGLFRLKLLHQTITSQLS